jgi:hypothetical protein
MSDRMDNAMKLAEKCWSKAMTKEPSFAEQYIELAEQLLLSKPLVHGDEFRSYCAKNGLFRPHSLHPNVWVSGVNVLKTLGWVHHAGYATPTKAHNHMPRVSLWTSMIYGRGE